MRSTNRGSTPIALVAVHVLAGCSLGRATPPMESYVLGGSPAGEAATGSGPSEGFTIGLRRLDLASYLATPAIVVRQGTNRMLISQSHRWVEDPGEGINRVIAGDLAAGSSVRAVDVAPWPARSAHDYLIQVHVTRFEGIAPEEPAASGGEAHVLASWEILRSPDGVVLARGVSEYREPGWSVGDYGELVSLLGAGVSALAADLTARIEMLDESQHGDR